jgi:ribosomal protein S18 acetylase RimI-like enzyme
METDEVLETGYGDGTPGGDNLLNDFARGDADAYEALARARGDRVLELPQFNVTFLDGSSGSPFGNAVVMRAPLDEEAWRECASHMHAFFAEAPGGPFLVMSAWPTPDLRPHDFGLVGHPPLMLRPVGPLARRTVTGFEIIPVTDAQTARDFENALIHGYPIPEMQPFVPGAFLPATALGNDRWRHFVGYLDGQPVATGSSFVTDHFQHVEFIAALDAARGRGIGYEITAHVTVVDPDRPAMLIASDLGRPIYDKLGYVTISRHTLWLGHRQS